MSMVQDIVFNLVGVKGSPKMCKLRQPARFYGTNAYSSIQI